MFIAKERKSFPSWSSFLNWKEEEEALTYTTFVRPKGEISVASRGRQSTLVFTGFVMLK